MRNLIRDNPGINISGIRKKLNIGNGTTYYHLSKLENAGQIQSMRRGRERVFWDSKSDGLQTHDYCPMACQRIIGLLTDSNKELSLSDIARELRMNHSVVRFHITELTLIGLVSRTRKGRKVICKINDPMNIWINLLTILQRTNKI